MMIEELRKLAMISPRFFSEDAIERIESFYKAKYVMETTVIGKHEDWVNIPMCLFYSEKEHPDSNSKYFAIYYSMTGTAMITSGQSAVESSLHAVEYNGQVFNSVYRHDYNVISDFIDGKFVNVMAIDGGRNYKKIDVFQDNVKFKEVKLTIVDGNVFKEYV